MTAPDVDRLSHRATGLLRAFNRAGVLDLADVHVADRVAGLGAEPDETVRLALALAVRGIRLGSVCLDLAEVGTTVLGESDEPVDVSALPWPDPDAWLQACEHSPLVAVGPDTDPDTDPDSCEPGKPLRLVHGLLYLDRYWRQEEQVRWELLQRALAEPPAVDLPRLRAALARLFPADEPDRQRLAAAVSALRWVTVLAGGPGTGKTTAVARLLALLCDQPGKPPRVALAAPTGKAAARLEEAVRGEAVVAPLGELRASTLHRLLGVLPGSRSRFRHNRENRLPYDVIVVDETSMVSLTLMARLLEATRPDARLVLVGDPDQLASVEAGAVLGDLTRAPGSPDPVLQAELTEVVGPDVEPVVNGVVTLDRTWRYGGAIDALARAIQAGDDDSTVDLLRAGRSGVTYVETGALDTRTPDGLDELRADAIAAAASLAAAARSGDVDSALRALESHRLLCAHRRGTYGVSRWSAAVERWLAQEIEGYAEDGEWYLGRPLLVTANDYDLGLYNGDAGVIVHSSQGPRAAFARGGAPTLIAPVRLSAVQTVHAMTVHRSQGSQFDRVSVLLPPAESPLLTRELLYTAVTRAQSAVRVVGTEAAVRAAVRRPIARASGLRHRLRP